MKFTEHIHTSFKPLPHTQDVSVKINNVLLSLLHCIVNCYYVNQSVTLNDIAAKREFTVGIHGKSMLCAQC